jgi:hypothetical protein
MRHRAQDNPRGFPEQAKPALTPQQFPENLHL